MNEEGGFEFAVLTTGDGLPIASSPNHDLSEPTGALVAALQHISRDIQDQLELKGVDEVTIRDHDRLRLVCRSFQEGEDRLILAAFVPSGHHYRRVTNRAIKRIKVAIRS